MHTGFLLCGGDNVRHPKGPGSTAVQHDGARCQHVSGAMLTCERTHAASSRHALRDADVFTTDEL